MIRVFPCVNAKTTTLRKGCITHSASVRFLFGMISNVGQEILLLRKPRVAYGTTICFYSSVKLWIVIWIMRGRFSVNLAPHTMERLRFVPGMTKKLDDQMTLSAKHCIARYTLIILLTTGNHYSKCTLASIQWCDRHRDGKYSGVIPWPDLWMALRYHWSVLSVGLFPPLGRWYDDKEVYPDNLWCRNLDLSASRCWINEQW